MDSIGTIIRKHRKLNGITQKQLADEFGVSQGTVAQWEGDVRAPSYETMKQLCIRLLLDANYFLGLSPHNDIDLRLAKLSDSTKNMITRFNMLSDAHRQSVMTLLDCLQSDNKREQF